jgi:hypothetical protein
MDLIHSSWSKYATVLYVTNEENEWEWRSLEISAHRWAGNTISAVMSVCQPNVQVNLQY